MTNVRRPWLAPLAVLLLAAALPGDELYLSDGRVIEGEIVSPAGAEVVDIRVGAGGLVAIQHFPRQRIERVVYGVSARQTALGEVNQQIAALSKRSDATAAQWWALARRLQDRGETAAARDLASRVVALDRQHADARRLLGMTRFHGVWMRANEAAIARGEVFFRGGWVSWAVQEQTLAEEARHREEQVVARQARDEQRRQARIAAAASAEATASTYPETYVSDYYRSPYYNPYGGFYSYGTGITAGFSGIGSAVCGPTYAWHIGAVGGSSNSAWKFNWNGAGGSGWHVR